MQKRSKWRRALALVLATTMVSQSCMITSIGGDTASTEVAQTETQATAEAEAERQAAEAAAAQEEAERQAAEAAAQAESERQAAEEAAKAESERQAAEEAAKAESERQAAEEAAKAESERQAAEEAAKAESESQAAEEAAKNEQQDDQTEEKNEEDMTPQLSDQTGAVPVEKPETEGQTEDEQKPEKDEPVKNEEAKDPGKTETEKEDVFYRVTFDSQAAVHGTIQADGASVGEDAVSSYYKEVKENDPYTFTVVPDEDYEIEYVRADQTDIPGTGNENEYRIANVTKDTVITVTYKEIPQDETSEGEDGEDVRKNVVTFQSDEGASVTVNGTDVTNGTGEAEDGKIVFAVVPAEGYQVTSVLVDGSIEARTTGNENEYIIEGIQTDETIVSVSTEYVGGEEETEAETEPEDTDGTEEEKTDRPVNSLAQNSVVVPMAVEDETDHTGKPITYYEVTFGYYKNPEDENIWTVITTQYIPSGESAVAPAAPDLEGKKFVGWDKEFENVTSDLTICAEYSSTERVTYTIEYKYENGTLAGQSWVAQLETGIEFSETVPTPDIEGFTPDQTEIIISGTVTENKTWEVIYKANGTAMYTVKHLLETANGGYEEQTTDTETHEGKVGLVAEATPLEYEGYTAQPVPEVMVNVDGSTVVEIRYNRNEYTLTWDTQGGTYYPAQRIKFGSEISAPGTPEKLGYEFVGWNNLPETMPAEDYTVTANWRENTRASYTVVYWLENLNGGYDYVTQETGTGVVGSEIRGGSLSDRDWERVNIEDPNGVERDTSRDETVVITADGKAVKNIYYNRKTFTIQFYSIKWQQQGLWGGEYVADKELTELRITAKYGEYIADQWNDEAHAAYEWNTTPGGSTSYTLLANMDAENIKVYQANRGSGTTITYYIEGLNGQREVYQRLTAPSGVSLTEEDQTPIAGFSFDSWKKNTGWSDSNLWLYYTRNKYTISFENCVGVPDATLKYEESLNNARPNENSVRRPAGVDDDYTFGGWYTSPACEDGTEVNWNSTMPSHNMQVYAKWVAPTYTVTFDVNGGDPYEYDIVSVTKYDTLLDTLQISELPDPTKFGEEFLGWYTDDDFYFGFLPDSQITENLTLHAKWTDSEKVNYYVVGQTQVQDPSGEIEVTEIYRSEPTEIVLNGVANVTAPELEGYYALETSKSVIINRDNQEIIFTYKPLEEWEYTVEYVDEDNNPMEGTGTETISTTNEIETVVFKAFEGYQLTSAPVVTVSRTDDATHKVVFTYAKNTAKYTIQYLLQYPDGTYYLKDEETVDAEQPIGTWVSVDGNDVKDKYPGFTLASSEHEMGGAVTSGDTLVISVYYNRDTIEVSGYEGTYDGAEHSVTVTGPEAQVEGDKVEYQYQLEDGTWSEWSENNTGFKNAGEYTVNVRLINTVADPNGEHAYIKEAKVKIAKRDVVLRSANLTKEYDGEPLTNADAEELGVTVNENGLATETGWADGEGASYNFTGSQTIVGYSKNAFSYELKDGTDADNYNINKTEGQLNVKNRNVKYEVTVTAKSDSKTYDGQELSVSGFENEVEGKGIKVTAGGNTYYVTGLTSEAKGTDVLESVTSIAVTGTAVVKDEAGNVVTDEFDVKVINGSLTINKADNTRSSVDLTKEYDGEPLTNADAEELGVTVNENGLVIETGWADGEGAIYNFTGSQTIVGYSKNAFSCELKDGTDADNYNINKTEGQLNVKNRNVKYEVTVTAKSDSKTYDGQELSVSGFENEVEGKGIKVTAGGNTYYVTGLTSEAKGTDVLESVTSIAVTGTAVVKDEAGNVVTDEFDVKVINGSLTINKADVTLQSADLTKEYDGEPLTNADAEELGVTVNENGLVIETGWADGEGAIYNFTGSQTIVGYSKNAFSYELKDGTDADNYNINKTEGQLNVKNRNVKYEVTVTAKSDSKTYDGQELSVSGFENEVEGKGIKVTAGGNTYYVTGLTSEAKGTDVLESVTSIAVTGTAVVKDEAGNVVTDEFDVKVINGSLTINKADVTLQSADLTKEYDGEPLTNADAEELGVTVNENGLVIETGWADGEGAIYNFTGSQTIVGYSKNAFSCELKDGTDADNYNINKTEGQLNVKNRNVKYEVAVTAKSDSKTYDGTPLTVKGFKDQLDDGRIPVTAENGLTYYVSDISSEITGTDVADSKENIEVEGTAKIIDSKGNIVTDQFNLTVHKGSLTIEKRDITLTSGSDTKTYDGSPLTNSDIIVSGDGWAEGEGATYTFTGSQTLVGNSKNTFSYELGASANEDVETYVNGRIAKEGNYNITTEYGILTVTDGTDEKPVDPEKVVVKTHDGNEFGLGETVTFEIRVTNIYDTDKTITLNEIDGVSLDEDVFENVEPGESITATATYTITSEDILKGEFVNKVTASFSGGKTFENTDTVTTEDVDAALTVEKVSNVPEGEKAGLNDVITYTITVRNDGNVPYTNLIVDDTLEGVQIQEGAGYTVNGDGNAVIAKLAVGASVSVTATYTVTEADISAGSVLNHVTVTGDEIPDENPKKPEGEDDEETPTDDRSPKLSVEKEVTSTPAAEDGKYVLGETITYKVTVTNTGNLTLNDIVVSDVLTRPDGTTTVPSGFDVNDARIDSLEPGASAEITYDHVIEEADLGGALTNAATATGQPAIPDPDPDTPDPDPTPDEPGEVIVDTEDPSNCAVTVTKQTTDYLDEAVVLEAGASFQVALFSDEAMTQRVGEVQTISFNGNSSTASVTFDGLKKGTYYVAEVDGNGNVIKDSGTYDGGVYVPQYANGNQVVIGENGSTAEFAFTNAFLVLPTGFYKEKTLTITKNVKDLDGKDMKVNDTFYAGIFTDESLTTLADNVSQNIVPLKLKGSSSVSVEVGVTVPTDGSELTLYVAEVNSAGVPVENVDGFAYNVEVENGAVTLAEESEDAAVVITNTSTEETKESECEPVDSQNTDNTSTGSSSRSVKTGDETPIMMLVCMLGLSAMAIILLASRRRRSQG